MTLWLRASLCLLAALSRKGKQITASATTGHHIHIDEPQLVIRAIREVVSAVP
jgi:hypothetical protein